MKADTDKEAQSKSSERAFKIVYRVTLALALVGIAVFCVVEFTRFGRRDVVVVASRRTSTSAGITTGGVSEGASLRRQVETLSRHLDEAQRQLAAKSNAVAALETKQRQTSTQLAESNKKLAALATELENRPAANAKETAPSDAEIARLDQKKRGLTAAIDQLTAQRTSSEDAVRRAKKDAEQSREELARVRREIDKARQDANKARQDIEKARQETSRVRRETDEARREKERFSNEVKRLEQQKKSVTDAVNRLRSEENTAKSNRRRAEDEIKRLQDKRRQTESELAALEKRKQEMAQAVWALTAQRLSNENAAKGTAEHGLRGTYFKSRDLSGPGVTRIDAIVDFDWKDRGPLPELGGDNFSARWEGQIAAPATGTFTFYTVSNDGVRLWINGRQLIDQWNDHGPTEHKGSIELKEGQRYDVKMEYYEAGGTALARLAWSGPGLSRSIVAAGHLFPHPDTPREEAKDGGG